jgi:iron(III) transport system substrate-binding protein
MLGNPNSSGTAYLMLATLVQVMGEDEAFRYLVDVNRK